MTTVHFIHDLGLLSLLGAYATALIFPGRVKAWVTENMPLPWNTWYYLSSLSLNLSSFSFLQVGPGESVLSLSRLRSG